VERSGVDQSRDLAIKFHNGIPRLSLGMTVGCFWGTFLAAIIA